MGKPAAFDVERVRDRALLLFWQKGFQAASLPELLAAMDLSRSSFYAAYGDKRRLFVECLDLFTERTRRILSNAREDLPPLAALQFFFARHLDGPGRGRASHGCLLVNTVLEMRAAHSRRDLPGELGFGRRSGWGDRRRGSWQLEVALGSCARRARR